MSGNVFIINNTMGLDCLNDTIASIPALIREGEQLSIIIDIGL